MTGAESLSRMVAAELAQLTPVELDAFVFGSKAANLPYSSHMYADDLDKLAAALLRSESAGDLIARITRVVEAR